MPPKGGKSKQKKSAVPKKAKHVVDRGDSVGYFVFRCVRQTCSVVFIVRIIVRDASTVPNSPLGELH